MRLGLRTGLLLTAAGALAGCLTSNPNLEESESSAEGGSTASTDPTVGPTSGPTTTPTSGPTTAPTTDGPTTVDPDTTDTETGTTDPSDTDETTGPAACGGGNVCVEEAPAGWAGPVVWAETPTTEDAPPCPAAYPELAFEALDDLQAAPAVCDCECGSAVGASCAAVILEYHGSDGNCLTPNDEFTMTATCSSAPSGLNGEHWQVDDPGVSGGSCTPSGTTDLPAAGWNSASTVCGGTRPVAGVCDGGESCIPAPPEGFEARACVWQTGDLECPSGAFSDRFVRHTGIDDTRNCQTCTCGSPEGECNGTVALFNSCGNTTGVGSVPIGGGSCVGTVGGGAGGARHGSLSVSNVSCEPSVGTAIGEAEPDDPYTLCCLTVE